MEPMTHLDQLKGIQAQIASLDLNDPMAVEMAVQLGSNFETVAGRIRKATDDARFDLIWNRPILPSEILRQEAEVMAAVLATVQIRQDISSPEEDAAFESLAQETAQIREAQRVDAAHPVTFDMAGFAGSLLGMKHKGA